MIQENINYSVKGKILVLRLFRLSHTPPSLYATQILQESMAPVLAIEFGNVHEPVKKLERGFYCLRLDAKWAVFVPAKWRSIAIFVTVFFKLSLLIVKEGRPKLCLAEGIQEECLALLLWALLKVPFAAHVYEAYEASELTLINRMFHTVGSYGLRYARLLIFPEVNRARIYKKRYHLSNHTYISYNCPRLSKSITKLPLREMLFIPQESFLMGYLGGVGYSNAMEDVIIALAEIPNLYFLIWGWIDPEYKKTLCQLADKFSVSERFQFLGTLNEEKLNYLASCEISYCVYRPDRLRLKYAATASNKLMESIAAGVPVITSGEADFREIVEKENVGVCVETISAAGLIAALKTIMPDESLRKTMSENAKQLHIDSFNYEAQFKEPLDAILKAAGLSNQTDHNQPILKNKSSGISLSY